MSAGLLPAIIRIRTIRDVVSSHAASYGDLELLKFIAGGTDSVCSIHFERFAQGDAERLNEFLATLLLAVHTGHFFNPADPPSGIFLKNSCVVRFHRHSLAQDTDDT